MARILASIGSLSIAATPTPLYTRSWCLWELLSAQRAGCSVDIRIFPGYRNDKILSVNALYKSFAGIAQAELISPVDQRAIYDSCIKHFGSEARSDVAMRALIEEKFADPWFELQDRTEGTKFHPQPFAWKPQADRLDAPVPYFLPGLLESDVFNRDMEVLGLFQSSGIVPPDYSSRSKSGWVINSRQEGDLSLGPEIIPPAATNTDRYKRVAMDVLVKRSDGGSAAPSPNTSLVEMNCPGCGRKRQYISRPYYEKSGDPASLWALFLQGRTANNQCVCGFKVGGAPSVFVADTWTAVTLEPPMGRSYAAEHYALLIRELLSGRKSKYPLFVFGSDEDLITALNAKSRVAFFAIPYSSTLYECVDDVKRRLMVAAAVAVDHGWPDLAYSFLRNACLIHHELFFSVECEMSALATAWDSSNEPSTLFETPLRDDLQVLQRALTPRRKAAWVDAGRSFICVLDDGAAASPGKQLHSAVSFKFDAEENVKVEKDTASLVGLPSWIVPAPALTPFVLCKLDVNFLAGGAYLVS